MTPHIPLETQINIMCSAIQTVLVSNAVYAAQMPQEDQSGKRYPGEEHRIAIGDTVITVGLNLVDPNDLGRALRLETPIAAEIARQLGMTKIGENPIQVTLATRNNLFLVEVTRPNPATVTWKEVAKHQNGNIILGRDNMRQIHALDIDRAVPGLLVLGTSGSGKTNIMRLLTAQAAALNFETHLVNMKGGQRDWHDFVGAVDSTAFTVEAATNTLDYIEQRIVARNRMEEDTSRRIILVWDEASKPHTPEDLQNRLGALASIARSSNVFLIVGTQTANAEIHKTIRDNLPNRLVFQASSALMANMNSNLPGSGAEKLLKFELLAVIEKFPRRMSVPRADAEDIADLIVQARNHRRDVLDEQGIIKWKTTPIRAVIFSQDFAVAVHKMATPGGLISRVRVEDRDLVAWSAVFQARHFRAPSRTELSHIHTARRHYVKLGQYRVDRINKEAGEIAKSIIGFEPNPHRDPKKWVKFWSRDVQPT